MVEVLRFIAAGLFNTGVSYAAYGALLFLGLAYPVANFGGLLAGMLAGFATHGHFVFGRFELRRMLPFCLAWFLLWSVNVLLIRAFLSYLGGNAYIAGALALLIMVPLSFLVQKHLVFGGGSGR